MINLLDRKEIWVAGSPSLVGGADVELLHQIVLWVNHEIEVNVVPNHPLSHDLQSLAVSLGCKIHSYRDGIFNGKIVVNYCNGPALLNLLNWKDTPEAYIFFNCMTWVFDNEIEAIKRELITHLGFVSKYQEDYLIGAYKKRLSNSVVFGQDGMPQKLEYFPYFDIDRHDVSIRDDHYFGVGRISREDQGKFSTDCWRIFDRVLSPNNKKVFMLGYDDSVEDRVGKPPDGMDFMTWSAGTISSVEFYSKIDVMIHKTGGSRESYCRVFVEAMAHGVVPLVERDYAFPEILQYDARLDWLMCSSSEEMSYKASVLAFNKQRLRDYKTICRKYVENYINNSQKSIRGWETLK